MRGWIKFVVAGCAVVALVVAAATGASRLAVPTPALANHQVASTTTAKVLTAGSSAETSAALTAARTATTAARAATKATPTPHVNPVLKNLLQDDTTHYHLRPEVQRRAEAAAPQANRPDDVGYQTPAPNPGRNETNTGSGPVSINPVVYNVFWLAPGQHFEDAATTASDTTYQTIQNNFIHDIGNTDFWSLVTQYNGNNGSISNNVAFGGSWVDTTGMPTGRDGSTANPILDSDLHDLVHRAATANGWTEDVSHVYVLYTALNVHSCKAADKASCDFNKYCAYHSHWNDGGNDAIYGNMPDVGGCQDSTPVPNSDVRADSQVDDVAHELMEAVTDPDLNAWRDSTGSEIGDFCSSTYFPRNHNGSEVSLHGREYVMQSIWSNAISGCALDRCSNSVCPPDLSFDKTAPATVTTGATFNYTITIFNRSNTDAAQQLSVSDTLPANFAYAGGASPPPASQSGQTLTWTFPSLAIKDTQTITIPVTANPNAANGATAQNCGSMTYYDSVVITQQSRNSCIGVTLVNQPPTFDPIADQASDYHDPVNFTISAQDAEPGDTLTFSQTGLPAGLTLTNNGNRTATVSGSPQDQSGTYSVTFAVNDGHNPDVTKTISFTITREESSLTYSGATVVVNGGPAHLAGVLLEDGNAAAPIAGRSVTFSLGSGSPQSCSGVTNASGVAQCDVNPVSQPPGPAPVTASFAGDQYYLSSGGSGTVQVFHPTRTSYTGATTSDYHDAFTASATLTDSSTGTPLQGKTVTFTLASTDTCSAATDASGNASCPITPTEAAGGYTITADFAGDANYLPSHDTKPFTVKKEETTATYTGPTVIANGQPTTLSGSLKEDGVSGIASRVLNFTLGTGATAQTCSGTTDASGNASCTLTPAQPLGPGTVSVSFAGDAYYLPSSASANTILFAFLQSGAFGIGDGNAAPGSSVYFWGSKWAKSNTLRGGGAPNAYKGFDATLSSEPPACGGTWSTGPGNSSNPPASVPSYMGVVVSSSVSKSGPTVSGDEVEIVVVKTDPGYADNPGHSGTGQVVAVFCGHP